MLQYYNHESVQLVSRKGVLFYCVNKQVDSEKRTMKNKFEQYLNIDHVPKGRLPSKARRQDIYIPIV